MRRWIASCALLLWAGAAAAAPFDTYQLIMWQERTPAQVAGLAQLGFTATKLRGTGGQIDAAELAAHRASGLPWYVENIATDFLAPYHRYVEGRSVTFLFEQAKARRRADPGDPSVFVREPSLSDPAWLARIEARLAEIVQRQRADRPLFYNLADEAGIGDLAAAWDADIGQDSLAAMRDWLRTQYKDLAALNAQWGTGFADWAQVMPELTDQALRRTDDNFSAWADFKAWMDVAFARAVRAGTDAVHRADPEALAALEGAQLPGWGGYDYATLAPTVDVMEIYDVADSLELARAFNPALIPLRTSFSSGAGDRHAAWRHLLRGGRGIIVWDERDDVVQTDGTPGPRGRELASLVASIRAVAPEVMPSVPEFDPVAVLVSQASFRTQWLLDRRPGGAAWSERDAGREYEDNAWRAGRREMLQRLGGLGVQPHLLSSAMLEAGALRQAGVRVLLLPDAIALSDAEVAAIRDFARQGGTVLADTEPGLFDGHSRKRASPPLTGVAQVPEGLLRNGNGASPRSLRDMDALLRAAGVAPRAVLRQPDGDLAGGVDLRWLRHGDTLLLALQTVLPYAAADRIEITLDGPYRVRDLRSGGPETTTRRLTVTLDPFEPTILALHPGATPQ